MLHRRIEGEGGIGDRSSIEGGTTPAGGGNGGAPPIVPLNREDVASHERRGVTTGACTEYLISTRTRARTREAARMGERSEEGEEGNEPTDSNPEPRLRNRW